MQYAYQSLQPELNHKIKSTVSYEILELGPERNEPTLDHKIIKKKNFGTQY